jgi:hypothetical protein
LVLKIAALFSWHGDIHFCTSGAFPGTTARERLVVENHPLAAIGPQLPPDF